MYIIPWEIWELALIFFLFFVSFPGLFKLKWKILNSNCSCWMHTTDVWHRMILGMQLTLHFLSEIYSIRSFALMLFTSTQTSRQFLFCSIHCWFSPIILNVSSDCLNAILLAIATDHDARITVLAHRRRVQSLPHSRNAYKYSMSPNFSFFQMQIMHIMQFYLPEIISQLICFLFFIFLHLHKFAIYLK